MNELEIFRNEEFGEIRTIIIDDEPWFVGKDIAMALGYKDTKNALKSHVDSEDKRGWQITTPGGGQQMTIINESGLYSLIMSSKMESAKQFKHWVTSEVLPSIRKHGMYATEDLLNNPDLLIAMATALKNERQARKLAEEKIEQQKPLVDFATEPLPAKAGRFGELLKQPKRSVSQLFPFILLFPDFKVVRVTSLL